MTPLRYLFGAIALLSAGLQAEAEQLCPPDPTYHCPPGFVRPHEPGRGRNPGPIYSPGPIYHPGPIYQPPISPLPPYIPPYIPENPPQYPPNPGYPGYPGPGLERREVVINRYMTNERLDLGLYLERGISVESVEVWMNNSYNTYANLNLLVDGLVEDSRSGVNSLVTLLPRRPVFMDAYSRRLQLEVSGQIYVSRLVITYRRGGALPPPNNGSFELSQFVNRQFVGLSSLDIGSLVSLHLYRGYRVMSVAIQGSSAAGHGRVEILANGLGQGGAQILPIYSTLATFYVGSPSLIGYDLNSLSLRMNGNIHIERVIVRVSR
jgi:hypothetical protein